jgi:hypothetical protein
MFATMQNLASFCQQLRKEGGKGSVSGFISIARNYLKPAVVQSVATGFGLDD